MNEAHELTLARRIQYRLEKLLAEAGAELLAAGELGVGVSVRQVKDTDHSFDPVRGVLTITGVIKIDVRGLDRVA